MQKTKQAKLDNFLEKMNTIPYKQLKDIKGGVTYIVNEDIIG